MLYSREIAVKAWRQVEGSRLVVLRNVVAMEVKRGPKSIADMTFLFLIEDEEVSLVYLRSFWLANVIEEIYLEGPQIGKVESEKRG